MTPTALPRRIVALLLLLVVLATAVQAMHSVPVADAALATQDQGSWADQREQDYLPLEQKQKQRQRRLGLGSFFGLGGADGPSMPFVSPSNGTDIRSPVPLIKCHNQTRCIQPYLQLQHTFKVYFCKHHKHGVRFFFLAREGLLLHPNIQVCVWVTRVCVPCSVCAPSACQVR